MEITMYFVVYIALLSVFVAFGRFMKECDESMFEQTKKGMLLK